MTDSRTLDTYADATVRKKQASDESVGWPLAANLALTGLGNTNKLDHKRLTPLILARLEARGDKPRSKQPRQGSVTPEQAAKHFNRYLANKHRHAEGMGGSFKLNFAQLHAEVNTFRMQYFPRLASDQVPEVGEIIAALRAKWGMKSSETALKRTRAKRLRAMREAQLDLFK